jgi:hypothetical protein
MTRTAILTPNSDYTRRLESITRLAEAAALSGLGNEAREAIETLVARECEALRAGVLR